MSRQKLKLFTAAYLSHALIPLLLLVPFFIACWLVKLYAIDAPFNDDFTFAEDWVKYKNHTLAFGDFFTAHMEHRVAVPRMIALGLHMLFGHDLRWQNGVTMALLFGTGWNLLVVWRRTVGASIQALWLPLLLTSSLLFCAIQWQPLLWPIMFEVFVPLFCFTLALRLWTSSMNHWWVLIISAVGSVAGTLSFGNGVLAWLLLPIVMLTARQSLNRRTRMALLVVWIVCGGITIGLYTHNLRNAAPSEFAYGQGDVETVGHDLQLFVSHISQAPSFLSALLGCHLSRGLHLHNIKAATAVGGVSLVLFTLSFLWLFMNRRDKLLMYSAAPWVTLGLYSIGTAMLITMARLWLTRSNALAITGRYVCHPIPLTIALIALLCIIGGRLRTKYPFLRTTGAVVGGALLFLTITQWIYGARMMGLWSQTRRQGKSLMLFAKVMPSDDYLASIAGDGGYAGRLIREMESVGSLRMPLLKNVKLNQFRISKYDLNPTLASFEGLRRNSEGVFEAEGFSELPGKRRADLVIFTYRTKPSDYNIFAITTLTTLPRYIQDSTYRDQEFMATLTLSVEITARWEERVSIISMPPDKCDIDAWALDLEKMTVYRINDHRVLDHPKLSKFIYPNSDEHRQPVMPDKEDSK